MVRLKNITIHDSAIECDIYLEDSLHAGHISVDTKTKEINDFSLPVGYEWCTNHLNHAKNKLIEVANLENIPDEKTIMWN